MTKHPISLSLKLTENEGTVSLIVEDEGRTIVDFENTEALNVRVVGFAKRDPQFQQIIAFMEREADSFSGGAAEALEAYIVSVEKQIYNSALHLRSEMRKLVLTGGMLRAAKILREQMRVGR